MSSVSCAACGRKAPDTSGWPDGWLGVAEDGSVLYPAPGGGAMVALENMPPSGVENEAVCSKECLEVVRKRRSSAS